MRVHKVVIPTQINDKIPFLYNHALDLTNKYKTGAVFSNHFISFSRASDKLVKDLNDLGVLFSKSTVRK